MTLSQRRASARSPPLASLVEEPDHTVGALRAQTRLCKTGSRPRPADDRHAVRIIRRWRRIRAANSSIGWVGLNSGARLPDKGRGTTTSSHAQVQQPMHASANQAGEKERLSRH